MKNIRKARYKFLLLLLLGSALCSCKEKYVPPIKVSAYIGEYTLDYELEFTLGATSSASGTGTLTISEPEDPLTGFASANRQPADNPALTFEYKLEDVKFPDDNPATDYTFRIKVLSFTGDEQTLTGYTSYRTGEGKIGVGTFRLNDASISDINHLNHTLNATLKLSFDEVDVEIGAKLVIDNVEKK